VAEQMLILNYKNRPMADKLMQHPFFKDEHAKAKKIHKSNKEKTHLKSALRIMI